MKSARPSSVITTNFVRALTLILTAQAVFGQEEHHQRQPAHNEATPKVRARVAQLGDGMTLRRDGGEGPAFVGMELRDGDKLAVKGKGRLNWIGGGTLSFEKPTTIVIGSGGQSNATPGITLVEGSVRVVIPKAVPPKIKFEASTATARCTVKGTVFSVWYEGDTKLTRLWVEEGTVVVAPINVTSPPITVLGGQQIEISEDKVGPVTRVVGNRSRPPEGENQAGADKNVSLSGTWTMEDGTAVFLTQRGTSVTGTYQTGLTASDLRGRLTGTFSGKYFRGTYQSNEVGGDVGTFQLALTPDGKLSGRWFSTSMNGREGSWTLTRATK